MIKKSHRFEQQHSHTETKRPVWLFSMDSDQFWSAPATTGGIKAYYKKYGELATQTSIELVHFRNRKAIEEWQLSWTNLLLPIAEQVIESGKQAIAGFSFYTWNAAEFLQLILFLKSSCPQLIVIVGGPHVQQSEDYLFEDSIDLVVLGEGEITFQQWLDNSHKNNWHQTAGLAYLDNNRKIHRTPKRERLKTLDILPSALEVVPLTDTNGIPLYDSYSYETARGCPFKCAFCEWGTGAIGSKMYQFSMARIRRDWRTIVNAGIKDLWLADSNFGALKEDLEKAQFICQLKKETGLPSSFATSWSKKHNLRTQEIVVLLNQQGLLPHYQLALQTLTPLALQLSNRKNMDSNKYEAVAKSMSEQGIPIAAELIWGLPGDNLQEFESNLDILLAKFPKINIFAYTLLPGTEFYEKRDEYEIKTRPVSGYGKAKGEYVIGCHTFSCKEGIEGYFLISAHIILNHGYIIPLTLRYLSLEGSVAVASFMRTALQELIKEFISKLTFLDSTDPMSIYENRDRLYLLILENRELCYKTIKFAISNWLKKYQASQQLHSITANLLKLDEALCPHYGNEQSSTHQFGFDAEAVHDKLSVMELPALESGLESVTRTPSTLKILTPGGLGDIITGPDAGSWAKGNIISSVSSRFQIPIVCV